MFRSSRRRRVPRIVQPQVLRTAAFEFHLHFRQTQGLNRLIRRMYEVFGYDVRRLQRVHIVNIKLGGLKVGRWRNLTEAEQRGLLPGRDFVGELHDRDQR